MADIPSIGGAITDLKKIQENFPLPGKREDVVVAFGRLLNLGGVQKVVVEYGKPMQVTRLVPAAQLSEDLAPEELPDDDVVNAARNSEMEEFTYEEELAPTLYLYHAFHALSLRKLKARYMVVNNFRALKTWLKANLVTEVFGVETREHKEIPDGVLLLVASSPEDADIITFSLRLEMREKP